MSYFDKQVELCDKRIDMCDRHIATLNKRIAKIGEDISKQKTLINESTERHVKIKSKSILTRIIIGCMLKKRWKG